MRNIMIRAETIKSSPVLFYLSTTEPYLNRPKKINEMFYNKDIHLKFSHNMFIIF